MRRIRARRPGATRSSGWGQLCAPAPPAGGARGFMPFGEPLPEARMGALLRPGDGIDTLISADVYGLGEADRMLGDALRGTERDRYCLVGAIGHDFYEGAREG